MNITWSDYIRAVKLVTWANAFMFFYFWGLICLEPQTSWDSAFAQAGELELYWVTLPTFLMVCYIGHQYYKGERAKLRQL